MNNLPNTLTFIRIAVIPFLIVTFYLPLHWGHLAAAILFTLASFTDWLDGYLARSLKQATRLGAFLDPVADKLMVSIALILIVGEPHFQSLQFASITYTIPIAIITIPAVIIVSREIIVSALREWMAEIGKRTSIAVSRLAKIKTAVQMIALIVLLACNRETPTWLILCGYALIYLASVLTIWSMILYLKAAWPELKEQ